MDPEGFQAGLGIRQSIDPLFDIIEKVFADVRRHAVIDLRGFIEEAEIREVWFWIPPNPFRLSW